MRSTNTRDVGVSGSDGADTIYGGFGSDTLIGNKGADTIYGNAGDDEIRGGAGADQLYGGLGADTFVVDDTDEVALGNGIRAKSMAKKQVRGFAKTGKRSTILRVVTEKTP